MFPVSVGILLMGVDTRSGELTLSRLVLAHSGTKSFFLVLTAFHKGINA